MPQPVVTPALRCTRSRRPPCSTAKATAARLASTSVTSQATKCPPASCAVRRPPSSSTSAATTRAPASPSKSETARPMAPAAPVTRATRSRRSSFELGRPRAWGTRRTLQRAARHGWGGGVGGLLLADALPREVLLGEQRVVARALDDAQQVGHRRDLLDLLLDEPLHELLARVVARLARGRGETVDLVGHALLLLERERDGRDDVRERRLRRRDARDRHRRVGVEQVLDHHHRV